MPLRNGNFYGRSSRLFHRQAEGEDAAGSGLAEKRDSASVRLHHHLAKREPEADTSPQAFAAVSALDKFFKYIFLFRFWNAFAIIAHLNGELPAIPVDRDHDLSRDRRGVAQGIRDQISEDAA